MASYNRIIMMGNLTRDPDYKQLSSGQSVCRLGLASNRQFKNRQTGDMVQEVCFVDVDVWGTQAESCSQYLQKGRGVLVEGRLKLDTWEDQDGQKRSKHSIVADRVTFLASQAQSDDASFEVVPDSGASRGGASSGSMDAASVKDGESSKEGTRDVPSGDVAVASASSSTPSGEVNFSDQKPFEDDLPF